MAKIVIDGSSSSSDDELVSSGIECSCVEVYPCYFCRCHFTHLPVMRLMMLLLVVVGQLDSQRYQLSLYKLYYAERLVPCPVYFASKKSEGRARCGVSGITED